METPALWSTIVADTALWNDCPLSETTLLRLVALSLERSRSHPLILKVAVEDNLDANHSPGAELMALLCAHSPRWKSIYLWHNYIGFELLASIKDRIPILENVCFSQQHEEWHEHTGMELFAEAPRLREFTVTGRAANLPTVPYSQLETFGFINLYPNDLVDAVTLIRRLDGFTGDRCWLRLDVEEPNIDLESLPSVTSNMTALEIQLSLGIERLAAGLWQRPVLGALLGAMTLPTVKKLSLINGVKLRSIRWDHKAFLQFAQRSMFQATLFQLELNRVLITDVQLIECLALTPCLTQLIIADCGPEHHALVTDTLIRRMSDDTSPLVPELEFLSVSTLLAFSDPVFIQFMNYRTRLKRSFSARRFEVSIYWLPTRMRPNLSAELLARASELELSGWLNFTESKDPEYDSIWAFAGAESSWGREL
ncbi:hypothetical protein C8F01DRAFT_268646 [Mycena amicta]|nr:hypothetical protein C8F01DRAFT_268646 [Mycena amicta]